MPLRAHQLRHVLRCFWISVAIVAVPASSDHLLWKYNFSLGDKVGVIASQFAIVLLFTFGIDRIITLQARQPRQMMHELRNWLTVVDGRIAMGNLNGAREAVRAIRMLLEDSGPR